MKKKVAVPLSAHSCTLQKVSLWFPPTYVPSPPLPLSTGVYLLVFLKGNARFFDALAEASVNRRLVPDVYGVWANFSTFQLYSPYEQLTFKHVEPLLGGLLWERFF